MTPSGSTKTGTGIRDGSDSRVDSGQSRAMTQSWPGQGDVPGPWTLCWAGEGGRPPRAARRPSPGRIGRLVVCSLLVSLLAVPVSATTSKRIHPACNRTISVDDPSHDLGDGSSLTLRLDGLQSSARGRPYYCWFRFEGRERHFVEIDVKEFRAGEFNDDSGGCQDGFLRISDRDVCSVDPEWLPPTTLCGTYSPGKVRVRRYTRSPSAFVEFKLDKANLSKGYEFDVTFWDKEAEDSFTYGHLQREDGRVPNTKCDWLIPVETCFGFCSVISPGHPGIYPPNTRCRYEFVNFDDGRVEVQFGGTNGKFDLKASVNCTEDYVEIYDGSSKVSPLIGRYCGHDTEFVISSGPYLLLIFESGPGSPHWDYSGFELAVTARWKQHHDGGRNEAGSCDWTFYASDVMSGDLHTPDNMIDNNTACVYSFIGEYNMIVKLQISVSGLQPDCQEYLDFYDGDEAQSRICADDLDETKRSSVFWFNSTSSRASVHYGHRLGQISNSEPGWVYFTFLVDPSVTGPPPEDPRRGPRTMETPGAQTSGVTPLASSTPVNLAAATAAAAVLLLLNIRGEVLRGRGVTLDPSIVFS